jgi:hypothetical protein
MSPTSENAAGLQKTLCLCPTTVKVSAVSEKLNAGQSNLSREVMLQAFQEMSDELGRRGTTGGVEGLFAEGKI